MNNADKNKLMIFELKIFGEVKENGVQNLKYIHKLHYKCRTKYSESD